MSLLAATKCNTLALLPAIYDECVSVTSPKKAKGMLFSLFLSYFIHVATLVRKLSHIISFNQRVWHTNDGVMVEYIQWIVFDSDTSVPFLIKMIKIKFGTGCGRGNDDEVQGMLLDVNKKFREMH